jgi:ribosomal protein L28
MSSEPNPNTSEGKKVSNSKLFKSALSHSKNNQNPKIDNIEGRNTYNVKTIEGLLNKEGSIVSLIPSIIEQSPNFVPLDKIPLLMSNAQDVFAKCKASGDRLLFGVLREYGDEKKKQLLLIGEKANIVRVELDGNSARSERNRDDNLTGFCGALNDEARNFMSKAPEVEHPKGPATIDLKNSDFYHSRPDTSELEKVQVVQMLGRIHRNQQAMEPIYINNLRRHDPFSLPMANRLNDKLRSLSAGDEKTKKSQLNTVDKIILSVEIDSSTQTIKVKNRYIRSVEKEGQNITEPKFNAGAIKSLIAKDGNLEGLMPTISKLNNYIPYENVNSALSRNLFLFAKLDIPAELYFERFQSSDDSLLFAMKVDDSIFLVGNKGSIVEIDHIGLITINHNPDNDLSDVCEVLNKGDMKHSFERYLDGIRERVEGNKTQRVEHPTNPEADNLDESDDYEPPRLGM